MSEFTSDLRQNACYRNLKWIFEDLLPCFSYAIKPSSGTFRLQVSEPASAGKGVDMSEIQALHCMTPEQWTWILCSVSDILASKLSFQELSKSIGIKLLPWIFLEILFLSLNFQGRNARFAPPPADAHDSRIYRTSKTVQKQKPAILTLAYGGGRPLCHGHPLKPKKQKM